MKNPSWRDIKKVVEAAVAADRDFRNGHFKFKVGTLPKLGYDVIFFKKVEKNDKKAWETALYWCSLSDGCDGTEGIIPSLKSKISEFLKKKGTAELTRKDLRQAAKEALPSRFFSWHMDFWMEITDDTIDEEDGEFFVKLFAYSSHYRDCYERVYLWASADVAGSKEEVIADLKTKLTDFCENKLVDFEQSERNCEAFERWEKQRDTGSRSRQRLRDWKAVVRFFVNQHREKNDDFLRLKFIFEVWEVKAYLTRYDGGRETVFRRIPVEMFDVETESKELLKFWKKLNNALAARARSLKKRKKRK